MLNRLFATRSLVLNTVKTLRTASLVNANPQMRTIAMVSALQQWSNDEGRGMRSNFNNINNRQGFNSQRPTRNRFNREDAPLSTTKLYIGRLDLSTTQDGLKEIFKPYTGVKEVELLIDSNNGMCRGFGFVEFENTESAQAALDGLVQSNTDYQVNFAKEKESFNNDPMRLYVGKLAANITDDKLAEMASAYGKITSAKVIFDRITMESRGYGFIQCASESECKKVLDGLLKNSTLQCNFAKVSENGGMNVAPWGKIYISGLSENTTDNDIFELCKTYGDVISSVAIVDRMSMQCKGFGFVEFRTVEEAKNAMEGLMQMGLKSNFAKPRTNIQSRDQLQYGEQQNRGFDY